MQNLFNIKIIDAESMDSDITSEHVDLSKCDGYSVYAKWTGSPVGVIKLQVSLDDVNFVDLSGSETTVNGASDALWEITTAFYDKVRAVFIRTSGTGTLDVQINGKGEPE